MINIEKWWCCLNPRERNALTALLPYFAFAGSYVTRELFDLYWFALGFAPDNAMVTWFIAIYGLIPGEITNPDETVTQVLYFDVTYWGQVYAFSLTDGFICSEQCRVLAYSNVH